MSIIPFVGALRRWQTTQNFEKVCSRLLTEVGSVPSPVRDGSHALTQLETELVLVDQNTGLERDGFRLLTALGLDEFLDRPKTTLRIMRVDIVNPELLRQLIQLDRFSGLFGVTSLLLTENDDRQTCGISYVVPSTLLTIDANVLLGDFARTLDEKVNSLVARLAA
jgi:hypothetical protein